MVTVKILQAVGSCQSQTRTKTLKFNSTQVSDQIKSMQMISILENYQQAASENMVKLILV